MLLLAMAVALLAWPSSGLSAADFRKQLARQNRPVLQLTNRNFQEVLSGPRDFDLVVHITATTPRMGCEFCREFSPVYSLVGSQFMEANPGQTDLFLAEADFSEANRELFAALSISNVPHVRHYPKTTELLTPTQGFDSWQFQGDDLVQMLVGYIQRVAPQLKVPMPTEPVNYGNIVLSAVGVAGLTVVAWSYLSLLLQVAASRQVWAVGLVITVLVFILGTMYNRIRNAPYARKDRAGNMVYFSEGHQNQNAVETQILITIYGALSVLMVALTAWVPKRFSLNTAGSAKTTFLIVGVVNLALLVAYALLLSAFDYKRLGLPNMLFKVF